MLTKPSNDKEAEERNMILVASKVLKVSPFGINILGGLPYINKLGLAEKANQYDKSIKFKYMWEHIAKDDNEKAICKCKIVSVNSRGTEKELTDWVVGECSTMTMSMGTLRGYQNHLAQTRAKNRAIQEAFGTRIHEDMMKNLEQLSRKKDFDEIAARGVGAVVSTYSEEIIIEEKKEKSGPKKQGILGGDKPATPGQRAKIQILGKELKIPIKDFKVIVGDPNFTLLNMTGGQAETLETEMLNKKLNNGKKKQ